MRRDRIVVVVIVIVVIRLHAVAVFVEQTILESSTCTQQVIEIPALFQCRLRRGINDVIRNRWRQRVLIVQNGFDAGRSFHSHHGRSTATMRGTARLA